MARVLLAFVLLYAAAAVGKTCRCIPGDACWPSASDWARLNETVEGRLITTVPLASVCHDPTYDADACAVLRKRWPLAGVHIPSSSSFSSPWAQNQSCDPYTPRERPCALGSYPVHAVNASTPAHAAAALRFAREHNVRLVVKSTGHDLLGKSSGAGSLSLWMHAFQGMDITQAYNGSDASEGGEGYTGPAVRIEPGVMGGDVQMAAQKEGLRVVAGTCGSVALGGGYTAGGGHSLLSGRYGLAADNVLAWEVVTAGGEVVKATPGTHGDLYWALSGGGAGVFGVVVAVTVKAFPDGVVSGAGISFNMTAAPSDDVFWRGVEAFHRHLPSWQARAATATYSFRLGTFSIQPVVLPDEGREALEALVAPFVAELDGLGIPSTRRVAEYATYLDLHAAYYGPLPEGQVLAAVVQVSRLLPRSLVASDEGIQSLTGVLRRIQPLMGGSLALIGNGIAVPPSPSSHANAVHPAWRNASVHQLVAWPWDWQAGSPGANWAAQATLVDAVLPLLEGVSAGSGTYLNEGNPEQPDWKEAFYGANYAQLRAVKARWDPDDVLYAVTGVGSDEWAVDGEGRLCRASDS